MNLLIINTLPEAEPAAQQVICALAEKVDEYRVIHTAAMRIAPCVGCNSCWLKTPGVCALKDDYEQILKAYLEYDAAIFISGTSLGVNEHRTKILIGQFPSAPCIPMLSMDKCVTSRATIKCSTLVLSTQAKLIGSIWSFG